MKRFNVMMAAIISTALLSFAFIGCSSDSSGNSGGGELFKCTNCNAGYTTQALAAACDKEYGCPEFDLAKNKDRVYYRLLDVFWMKYDKDTGEITQAWGLAEDIMGTTFDIFIPAASYKETLDEYDIEEGDHIRFQNDDDEADDYAKMLAIINDTTTKKCTIGYFDALPILQGDMPFKFTEDIKVAFKNKENPVLPAKLQGHKLLYIYFYETWVDEDDNETKESGQVFIADFDDMKIYYADDSEKTDNNIELDEEDEPSELCISGMKDFPDLSSKQVVANPTGYSLMQEDDAPAEIDVGKGTEEFTRPINSQIFVDKNGKYFINYAAG